VIYLEKYISTREKIENKIKTLKYVESYVIDKLDYHSSPSTMFVEKFVVKLFILENIYLAYILGGDKKVEEEIFEVRESAHLYFDIYYV
jgi:hypothetical protein